MKVSAFNFDLPEDAIALSPARPRDSARLLGVSADGVISDHHVFDLPNLLKAGDILVINETRVLRAALSAIRPAREHGGGGDVKLDINLHKRESDSQWRAFVRPAKRVRDGDIIHFSSELSATVNDKRDGGDVSILFNQNGANLDRLIEQLGSPPLPPYIGRKRSLSKDDNTDYQTIFARETGSVAAPTAGLHFTSDVFAKLNEQGISVERLTLHVGAGTFLPVKSDDTAEHKMHSEWFMIDNDVADRINAAKKQGRRIIAVGTTSLRALESSARDGLVVPGADDTEIFITPGYDFKIVDGLMTNFHLPKSTLFMLVSAFSGLDVMQSAYGHAIENGYRFYSYGDTSLLWRQNGY